MSNVTYVKQQKARIQFWGLYFVSLVLIFLVVSAFWKSAATPVQEERDASAEKAVYYMQADTLLHRKLQAIDAAYAGYFRSDKSATSRENIETTSSALQASLDSMNMLSMALTDGPKKEMLLFVMNDFKKMLQNRNGNTNQFSEVAGKPVIAKEEKPATPEKQDNNSNKEMDALKQMLVDKENRIAALENQLKQKPAVTQTVNAPVQNNSNPADGEWKQKYVAVKANYDKALARENELKAAYKTVVDDNRKLLHQLQSKN